MREKALLSRLRLRLFVNRIGFQSAQYPSKTAPATECGGLSHFGLSSFPGWPNRWSPVRISPLSRICYQTQALKMGKRPRFPYFMILPSMILPESLRLWPGRGCAVPFSTGEGGREWQNHGGQNHKADEKTDRLGACGLGSASKFCRDFLSSGLGLDYWSVFPGEPRERLDKDEMRPPRVSRLK